MSKSIASTPKKVKPKQRLKRNIMLDRRVSSTAIVAIFFCCLLAYSFLTFDSLSASQQTSATQKSNTYQVRRPVRETHTKVVDYTVRQSVQENHTRQVAYTQMTLVREQHSKIDPETGAETTYTVAKHIPVQRTRTVNYTVTRMIPKQIQKTVEFNTLRFETTTLPRK